MKFARNYMELENIILNEVTQTQKDKCGTYSLIEKKLSDNHSNKDGAMMKVKGKCMKMKPRTYGSRQPMSYLTYGPLMGRNPYLDCLNNQEINLPYEPAIPHLNVESDYTSLHYYRQ
ncbi:hypothetical protein STEG23_036790, partial [Scotinomys teguina]